MAGMTTPAVPMLLLISILAFASVPGSSAVTQAGRRQLHQATAVASSVANAGPGTTAISSNDANAVSTGAPTTAVSQGVTDTTGSGQSISTKCSAYALNSATYKRCANGQVIDSTSTASRPKNGISFVNAATCTAPLGAGTFHVGDSNCRYWGYQNNDSCAYKDGAGNPLNFLGSNCTPVPI